MLNAIGGAAVYPLIAFFLISGRLHSLRFSKQNPKYKVNGKDNMQHDSNILS